MTAAAAFDGEYDPWRDLAARFPDWEVDLTILPKGILGLTNFDLRQIVLDKRQMYEQARATLTHEIVHLECGHEVPQPPAVEAWVEQVAAQRLIRAEQFYRAAFATGPDVHSLGRELTVDSGLVRSYWSSLNARERKAIRASLRDDWADCWIA